MAQTEKTPTGQDDPYYDRIGARIRAARRRAGLSHRQFAEKLGWGVNEIMVLERGKAPLTIPKLRRLAAVLGLSLAQLVDTEVEIPPDHKPPPPGDPNYVFSIEERRLLQHYRQLVPRERRVIMLLAGEMPTTRDLRYDPEARKLRHRWSRPGQGIDPLSPKATPANGLWLRDNSKEYHGQWVAIRNGKLLFAAPTRPELVQYLVGMEKVLIVSLLDLKKPILEKYDWYKNKNLGIPPEAPPAPPPAPPPPAAAEDEEAAAE